MFLNIFKKIKILNFLLRKSNLSKSEIPKDLGDLKALPIYCSRCKQISDIIIGDPRVTYIYRNDVGVLIPTECPNCKIGLLVRIKDSNLKEIKQFNTPSDLQVAIEEFVLQYSLNPPKHLLQKKNIKTNICSTDTPKHTKNPFYDEKHAASNIMELMNHLSSSDNGSFIYRGQTKKYPGPLLPSAFRNILQENPVIENDDELIKKSILGIGKRFIGNYTWDLEDYHERIANEFLGDKKDPVVNSKRDAQSYLKAKFFLEDNKWTKYETISPLDILNTAIYSTNEFNSYLLKTGYEEAERMIIQRYCPPALVDPETEKLVRNYIDHRHRYRIFTDIIISTFSYVMGSLISQQYGFQSGLLDATSSIEIASFFATHDSPDYKLIQPNDNQRFGVIYKIPQTSSFNKSDAIGDSYGKNGTLVMHDLLSKYEDNITFFDSLCSIRNVFENRCEPEEFRRLYNMLSFPRNSVSRSRIGHQKACVVIPDQIEIKLDEVVIKNIYGTNSINVSDFRIQMSIEDINHRPGVECYYFQHTKINPCPNITPSFLWPNEEDYFLKLLTYALIGGFSFFLPGQSFVTPRRLDLFDPGFGSINFVKISKKIKKILSDESKLFEQKLYDSKNNFKISNPIYKASCFIYAGNVTDNNKYLKWGLELCKREWASNNLNPTLVSLILIALKSLKYEREFNQMIIEGEKALSQCYGKTVAHKKISKLYEEMARLVFTPMFSLHTYRLYIQEIIL